jgi:hypothetical protein
MHHLSSAHFAAPARAVLSDQPAEHLNLRVALLRADRPHSPVAGVLLDDIGLRRLRRIVRHLPGPLFAHVRVALGEGVALLVASNPQDTIEGLPLGQPLARAEPPELLLPRGLHVRPALPADLLIPALGLQPDMLTVLTPVRRYDVALDALQPLASLLTLDAPAHIQHITLQASTPPPLDLEPVIEHQEPVIEHRQAEAEHREQGASNREAEAEQQSSAYAASFEEELRQRAARLEQAGDHATAAVFYDYLGDDERAAACYQQVLILPQERR